MNCPLLSSFIVILFSFSRLCRLRAIDKEAVCTKLGFWPRTILDSRVPPTSSISLSDILVVFLFLKRQIKTHNQCNKHFNVGKGKFYGMTVLDNGRYSSKGLI